MNDHRVCSDRRRRDNGPPGGCAERRVRADRRLPVIEELDLSCDEFSRMFGGTTKISDTDHPLDAAAMLSGRLREH